MISQLMFRLFKFHVGASVLKMNGTHSFLEQVKRTYLRCTAARTVQLKQGLSASLEPEVTFHLSHWTESRAKRAAESSRDGKALS